MSGVGIDTNVLLRMVFNEDAVQRAKALEFGRTLSPDNPGFVSLIVVVELNWALSSIYRQPKAQILATLRRLLRTNTLAFESFDAVVRAVERADDGPIDFTDALIAEHNRVQGCSHTVTFDKRAARNVPGMELLA